MSLLVAKADGITPATADFTLDHPDVNELVGPYWVSVQAWTHTADGAAGALVARMEYDDPTGQTRTVEISAISLADGSDIKQVGPSPIERENGTSNFRFRTELFGSAGTALVSYRLIITQADVCSLQTLTLVPE